MDDAAHDGIGILRRDRQFRVLAMQTFEPGDAILSLAGVEVERPSPASVQIDVGRHMDVPPGLGVRQTLDEHAWRFVNHSCDPNTALRDRDFIALRKVERWDEITFDYDTTEWEMTTPFRCTCGSEECAGAQVRGFRHLTDGERERRRSRLTPHLLRWWEEQASG